MDLGNGGEEKVTHEFTGIIGKKHHEKIQTKNVWEDRGGRCGGLARPLSADIAVRHITAQINQFVE